ncbi:phage tail protein [Xenorhabdus stockiae]|uniref:Phage tail protein n=1 Tax=Xenorhabdus stockiae TaxID=351614 RepID=A0A2D0KB55_9GAMM|nr:phage tail protein [Xenorhabdus stockiae]
MGNTTNRLAGTAYASVNGISIMVVGDFTYSPSTITRETLTGMDYVHGYKEKPNAPYISCRVRDSGGTTVADFNNQTNVTIVVELANGKTINPLKESGRQPRGIRNNNPGNLTAAPHAVGKDYGNNHTYVKFDTAHDGLSAMARQLMLDAERGLNTIELFLDKYASEEAGNNTEAYVRSVSQRTGYARNQRLDMHDPEVLNNLMAAMIKHENDNINPYSYEQIKEGVNDAIHSDRWRGLRKPEIIREQRLQHPRNKRESQPEPSLYGNKKESESQMDIVQSMAKAFQEAIAGKPFQLEVTLVNDKTGERQRFQSKPGGKVTTSMQQP